MLSGFFSFSQLRTWVLIRRFCCRHWLGGITCLLLLSALSTLYFAKIPDKAHEVGDFVAGFAAALAFLWLIASFRVQAAELRMQRTELSLQREAIHLQTKELKAMGRFSALEHVKTMVDEMVIGLEKHPENQQWRLNIEKPDDLITTDQDYFCEPPIRPVFTSKSLADAQKDVGRYLGIQDVKAQFIRAYISACHFYLTSTGGLKGDANDKEFLALHDSLLRNVPYLSHYLQLAQFLIEETDRNSITDYLIRSVAGLERNDYEARMACRDGSFVQSYLEIQNERGGPIPLVIERFRNGDHIKEACAELNQIIHDFADE